MKFIKTKIVCSIGPTSHDLEIVKKMLIAGMNIARFNFSHDDHAWHGSNMEIVREASKQTGIPVALMMDTKGPEIRTGFNRDEKKIDLIKGKRVTLTTEEGLNTDGLIHVSYKNLPQEVHEGGHILVADGAIDLQVLDVDGPAIHCQIIQGGKLGSRKNMNIPGVRTALPAVGEQDEEDIIFGIEQKIDFIAASFIRKSSDVMEIQEILDRYNAKASIVAKIEDEEGVENAESIIGVAGGIMVARGDLGVQLSPEEIPLVQKQVIRLCNQANVPVITATQMLDSMTSNPRPTRAEVSDVANAIFDGTDAVMLSGETAAGKYPVHAVKTMHNIAAKVESSPAYQEKMSTFVNVLEQEHSIKAAICKSAFVLADNIGATAILTPSMRGSTPKVISQYRPKQMIIAPVTTGEVLRNLLLHWGVYPILRDEVNDSDELINTALKTALEKEYINHTDRVVMAAGVPVNSPVMLNTIRVHVISTVLSNGTFGFGEQCTGRIVKVKNATEAHMHVRGTGDEILLTRTLTPAYSKVIPMLRGIIVQRSSSISPEVIKHLNPSVVFIQGATDAVNLIENQMTVSLDGEDKLIYEGVIPTKKSSQSI